MSETQKNMSKRKFGWVDKWAKMTGERARIDAKANNTYIVYEKDIMMVIVNAYTQANVLCFCW